MNQRNVLPKLLLLAVGLATILVRANEILLVQVGDFLVIPQVRVEIKLFPTARKIARNVLVTVTHEMVRQIFFPAKELSTQVAHERVASFGVIHLDVAFELRGIRENFLAHLAASRVDLLMMFQHQAAPEHPPAVLAEEFLLLGVRFHHVLPEIIQRVEDFAANVANEFAHAKLLRDVRLQVIHQRRLVANYLVARVAFEVSDVPVRSTHVAKHESRFQELPAQLASLMVVFSF